MVEVRGEAERLWQRLQQLHAAEDKPLSRAVLAIEALQDADDVKKVLREVRDQAIRDAAALGATVNETRLRTRLSRSTVEKARYGQ